VASWFDSLRPLKGRAGLDLEISAALLLLVAGPQALAEDESRPRGLRCRRCVASRRKPASGGCPIRCRAAINRTLARRRLGLIDRSPIVAKEAALHSASYFGISVAKKLETAARLGNHSIPIRGSGAPLTPQMSRNSLHRRIIQITLPVHPHMVTRRATLMHWDHPGRVFR
jgi:hypothetical protein